MFVAGVDGCKTGWVVALHDLATGTTTVSVVTTFASVLALPRLEAIAVDIPIGLLSAAVNGGRDCERLARPLLGSPRCRSVFSAPVRSALVATDFSTACALNRASSPAAVGISQQCFALFRKLQEVDAAMTAAHQARVFEVHPELCFFEMAGRVPMMRTKKTAGGRAARAHLLQRGGIAVPASPLAGAAADDVLDALVACWTARRIRNGVALRIPSTAPVDARGLRMELWR